MIRSTGRRYRRNEEFILRKIGDDTLLVPLRQDAPDRTRVFVLNELGARLWQDLEKSPNLETASRQIAAEYDAPPQRIMEDAASFAAQLEEIGALLRDAEAA